MGWKPNEAEGPDLGQNRSLVSTPVGLRTAEKKQNMAVADAVKAEKGNGIVCLPVIMKKHTVESMFTMKGSSQELEQMG